jgi:SAM-dependent methyltransferase
MKPVPVVIDLGGGFDPADGAINLERHGHYAADIEIDLELEQLPFEDNSVDRAHATHVLEHIRNLIPLMNDVHRVLKPAGWFIIEVPLFPSVGAMKDPTHVRYFVPESFDYFDRAWDYERKPDYGIQTWWVDTLVTDNTDPDYAVLRVSLRKPTNGEQLDG